MTKSLLPTSFAVLMLIFFGCNSVSQNDPGFNKLDDSMWEMTEMSIDGTTYQGVADFFDINFADSKASGRSDCNFWSANYSFDSTGDFTLSSMTATEIACQQSSIEGPYFDALIRINAHRNDKGNLVLTSPAGDTITFEPISQLSQRQ